MSGGHWEYEQYRLQNLADQVRDDAAAKREFPQEFLDLVARVGTVLADAIHDMDWCLSGDTIIEDPVAYAEEFKLRLKRELEKE